MPLGLVWEASGMHYLLILGLLLMFPGFRWLAKLAFLFLAFEIWFRS